MLSHALWLCGLALLAPASATPTQQPDPTVTIDIGVLHGTQTALPEATGPVHKFLGVPFAVSPPERFSKPRLPDNLTAPLEAKTLPKACMQSFFYPKDAAEFQQGIFNNPVFEESEDCLYLNVFAPSSPAPPEGRTVMFWIYGGGLLFGHGSLPQYDGSAFAAYQDVIVVTHNYRTNMFGFPASPLFNDTEQNLGFYDQRMALDWVTRNIHAFGGDPKKVTIFGESAGGASVDAMLGTYTTENAPFRGAILQSSQQTYRYEPKDEDPYEGWRDMVAKAGCEWNHDILACMRAVPATNLKDIIEKNSIVGGPIQDDVTYAKTPITNRRQGRFAKVPVLIGSNANEGRTFVIGQDNILFFLHALFGKVPYIIPRLLAAFPFNVLGGAEQEFFAIADVATFFGFQCLMAMVADDTRAQGVPTFRYYYDAEFPNLAYANNSGVWHSSEITMVFNTYPGGPVNPVTKEPWGLVRTNLPPTDQQKALGNSLNKAWADFAKDPSSGPGWASMQDSFGGVAQLGSDGSDGVHSLVSHVLLDAKCPLFAPQYKAANQGVAIKLGILGSL